MRTPHRATLPAVILLLAASPAVARQACPPAMPALPAPARNPVSLTLSNQEQWFTVPVTGGHIYELAFESSLGATARLTVFGRDCSRPIAGAVSSGTYSRWFTVPSGEDLVHLRVITAAGLIEPVVGSFQLADLGPTADSVPNDASWARVIVPDGVWMDGAIDYAADSDSYRLSTIPGGDYRIEVRGLGAPGCLGQYRIDHNGSAVRLFRATSTTELVSLPHCPLATGFGNGLITYQIRALASSDPFPPDRPDTCAAATPAPLAAGLRGEVSAPQSGASDEDAYVWPVAARHAYHLSWVGDVHAELLADSCSVPCVTSGAWNIPTGFVTDRDGVVRVVVNTIQGSGPVPYEIRLDDLGPVEADESDQVADATPLAAGASAFNGTVGHGSDSDVFRLVVDPGWVYELVITGDVAVLLLDPVHPSRREQLSGSTSVLPTGTMLRTVRFLMPTNEPAFRHVVVQAGWGPTLTPMPYSIALRRANFVGAIDAPDDPDQASPIGIDGPMDFHLDGNQDADWLAYDGPGRRKYRVALVGATELAGGLSLWFGRWAESELLPGDVTTLETDTSGRLLLGGSGWSSRPSSLTAAVTDIGPATDAEPDTPNDAFAIRPNRDTVRAVLDSGSDHDLYKFMGRPGHAYRIVLRSGPGVGLVSAQVREEADVRPLRAFGVVEPPAGEPVTWSVSPRFTQPPPPAASVLDISAGGQPITQSEYYVRVESVCRVDWNDDGAVGVSDLLDYLTDFLGDAHNAEFDHAGDTTIADLVSFLTEYFVGCPE